MKASDEPPDVGDKLPDPSLAFVDPAELPPLVAVAVVVGHGIKVVVAVVASPVELSTAVVVVVGLTDVVVVELDTTVVAVPEPGLLVVVVVS